MVEQPVDVELALREPIPVLDHGTIALEAHNADDLSLVNAARASFGQRQTELQDGNEKLIAHLIRNKHGSVTEHNFFRWHVKLPIFVVREWHRHRIGWSYNEMSGRYTELPEEFYVPARDDVRHQVGKPGAYKFERMEDDDTAESVRAALRGNSVRAFRMYQRMLEQGIAKEIARLVLPVNTYTQMYATCNARSLMHFLALRNSEHAQREIRAYAQIMEEIFALVMPITHGAFIDNGRVAP